MRCHKRLQEPSLHLERAGFLCQAPTAALVRTRCLETQGCAHALCQHRRILQTPSAGVQALRRDFPKCSGVDKGGPLLPRKVGCGRQLSEHSFSLAFMTLSKLDELQETDSLLPCPPDKNSSWKPQTGSAVQQGIPSTLGIQQLAVDPTGQFRAHR